MECENNAMLTVINDEGHRDQILLMLFHCCMARELCLLRSRRCDGRTCGLKSSLKILYVQPEAQILLTEIAPQEFAEQAPQSRFFEDLLQTRCMTILVVVIAARYTRNIKIAAEAVRERCTPLHGNRGARFVGWPGFVAWSNISVKVGFRGCSGMVVSGFVPFRNGDSFFCDFVNGSLCNSKFRFLLRDH